jgi:hypothetical protein
LHGEEPLGDARGEFFRRARGFVTTRGVVSPGRHVGPRRHKRGLPSACRRRVGDECGDQCGVLADRRALQPGRACQGFEQPFIEPDR